MGDWRAYVVDIVRRWAYQRRLDRNDEIMQDLHSDALVALWQASLVWDASRCTFPAFLATRIPQRLIDGLRSRNGRRQSTRDRRQHEQRLSLDDLDEDEEPSREDEQIVEFLSTVASLDPRSRYVAIQLANDVSRVEIGRQLHCSERTVGAIVNGPLRSAFLETQES